MANKHIKYTQLIIREMQIKIMTKYHYWSMRMVKWKKKLLNAYEEWEHPELSHLLVKV